jgi:hypothetical protein
LGFLVVTALITVAIVFLQSRDSSNNAQGTTGSVSGGSLAMFHDSFGEWLTLPPGATVSGNDGDVLELQLSPAQALDWIESQASAAGLEVISADEDSQGTPQRVWKKADVIFAAVVLPDNAGGSLVALFRTEAMPSGGGDLIIGERR